MKPSLHIYTSSETSRELKTKAAFNGLSVSELVEAMIIIFLEDERRFEDLVGLVVCNRKPRKAS